ncbi:hypothetical protein BZA77DRAFT_117094 [Pyronema omphalodes]|nr:hypothetical protein BZA77DRAFT_117094 [Pyronema omphalodes]
MPLTIIRTPPSKSNYEALSTFQAATPASFSTPVLYHHEVGARVLVSREQAGLIPIFVAGDGEGEGKDGEGEQEITVQGIELWVTNENIILYNTPLNIGAIIPYLSLTLHAVTNTSLGSGVYLQISLTPEISTHSNSDNYDDEELVELTLVPSVPSATACEDDENNEGTKGNEENKGSEDKDNENNETSQPSQPAAATATATQKQTTQTIFQSLSLCTSLHSSNLSDNSEDEDLDNDEKIIFEGDSEGDDGIMRLQGFPSFPGQGGWITAENVDQFRFEDMEVHVPFVGLGQGAGVVRNREDEEEEEEQRDEAKWRRVE